MSKYTIFGKTVEFNDAADRYCKSQFFAWDAAKNAAANFDSWYIKCGNIYDVLDNFWPNVKQILIQNTLEPLYNTLATNYEIYNISQESYYKQCLDLDECVDVYDLAADRYNEILDQLEEEKEYREYRKASRSEVIGGGFGLGGAIKGMLAAGAINMATGAAHSVANSIGNASSEGDANARKARLYKDAQEPLRDAVERCVLATAYRHIEIVNDHSDTKIISSFDSDQASALLENAKRLSDKREELLVESFKLCPWSYKWYPFVFEKFPNERRNIIAIGKHYRIDLTDQIEELLRREYPEDAKNSEKLALESKARIKAIMDELGVENSCVLNQLESDCIARLCPNIQGATENICNQFIEKINAYDALSINKQPYIDKIKERIEAIWAKEDGDIFDNYIMQLNILDPKEVANGIKFVKQKARTKEAEKYITALASYTSANIKKVRMYRMCAKKGFGGILLSNLGWAILGIAVYTLIAVEEPSFWLHTMPLVSGSVIQFILYRLKKLWTTATVDGKVIHPVFTMTQAEFAQKTQASQN